MNLKRDYFLIIKIGTILGFLLCLSINCQAGDTVTVVTYSQKYSEVTYKIDHTGTKMLLFLTDGETEVSISDIRFIVNKDGDDVTKLILGNADIPKSTPLKKNTPVKALIKEQNLQPKVIIKQKKEVPKLPWDLAIQIGPSFCFTGSEYYRGIERGVGYQGELHLPVYQANAIRFSISGVKHPTGDEYKLVSTDSDIKILDQKSVFKTMRYRLEFETFQLFNDENSNMNMYYGHFGFGFINQKLETNATLRRNSTREIAEIYTKISNSNFELTVGFGSIIAINKTVGLDIAVGYDMVFLDEGKADLFDIKAGVFIPFNFSK
jgi:hypothetical protein